MTNGINGDYGQFKKGNILQPNGIQNGEVKKAEAAPNEPIINFNSNNNKELGFDLLTQNAGSAYGKALTLSTDFSIDKGLTRGLSGKEMAALQKELNPIGDIPTLPFSSERKIYKEEVWNFIEQYINN